MFKINENYLKLPGSYLFSNIAKKVNVFSEANINIAHMTNKSRGEYAYCVFDIDSESSKEVADKLSAIDGVLKVRVVK